MGSGNSKQLEAAKREAEMRALRAEAQSKAHSNQLNQMSARMTDMEEQRASDKAAASEQSSMLLQMLAKLMEKMENPPVTPARIDQQLAVDEHVSIEELRRRAKEEMGIDSERQYNFAVCGYTGTGKSSIINALRKMSDEEEGAAPVGEVETTSEVTAYPYPGCPHIVLWDTPGGGTTAHEAQNYFVDKKLYAFDCLVVVTAERFSQLDLAVARSAHHYRTPIVFVRSKVDVSVQSKMRRGLSEAEAKQKLREEVETKCRPQLAKIGQPTLKIFLVTSWAFSDLSAIQNDEAELVEFVLSVAAYRAGI